METFSAPHVIMGQTTVLCASFLSRSSSWTNFLRFPALCGPPRANVCILAKPQKSRYFFFWSIKAHFFFFFLYLCWSIYKAGIDWKNFFFAHLEKMKLIKNNFVIRTTIYWTISNTQQELSRRCVNWSRANCDFKLPSRKLISCLTSFELQCLWDAFNYYYIED